MKTLGLTELCQIDLVEINGGEYEEYYNMGYSAGVTVGKMARNLLTLVGISKLFHIL